MKVINYSSCKEHQNEFLDESKFLADTNTAFVFGYNQPKIKSHIKIGNLIFHNTHHFNWFHRMMWKLCFGFEIENLKGN